MVYRGKPSSACERCRSRRLKCDQGTPTCSPCNRAKVECPGYRNTLDLAFRNQNDKAISLSQRSARKKQHATTKTANIRVASSSSSSSSPEYPNSVPYALENSLSDLAMGYFFSHYITGGIQEGYMSYLLPLINDPYNVAVISALNAVGLAALSNIRSSPQMMLKARREYTKALSETNKGLADIATSDRDDILAAVVLLGMYEVVTCSDGHFIDRWMKHVEGAARLVEYRGLKQLERREGLEMFTQLRLHINTCDIYRKRRSTALYIRLTENAMKYRDENDQIIDLLCLEVIQLADLRASIEDRSIYDPGEIIRKALTIDANLASLFISVPTPWQYHEVENPFSNGPQIGQTVWGTIYHLYGSLRASNMWNNWRSVRILLHELIIDTVASLEGCSPGPERRQQLALAAHSRFIASQLVEDICASVPYHLGAGTEDSDQVALPVTGAGGFCLMWQLLIAANSGLASQDLRSWIMDCLDKIGYSMGINQALAMSQLLRAGKQSESLHLPENHNLGFGRNHFIGLIEE